MTDEEWIEIFARLQFGLRLDGLSYIDGAFVDAFCDELWLLGNKPKSPLLSREIIYG